jgi:hypothetical protein
MRNAYRIFLGKPDGKRPLRKLHKWESNFKMNFKKRGWEGVDLLF